MAVIESVKLNKDGLAPGSPVSEKDHLQLIAKKNQAATIKRQAKEAKTATK